jgi:hypothetical protein
MWLNKGIAIAFASGFAVAIGAVLLLRDTSHEQEGARIAELDAQIQRLDKAVSRLSVLAQEAPGALPSPTDSRRDLQATPAASSEPDKHSADENQAIAEADALVDRGLVSGHWSREQADDLTAALSGLDVREQGRIQARISAAINEGKLQIDLR